MRLTPQVSIVIPYSEIFNYISLFIILDVLSFICLSNILYIFFSEADAVMSLFISTHIPTHFTYKGAYHALIYMHSYYMLIH